MPIEMGMFNGEITMATGKNAAMVSGRILTVQEQGTGLAHKTGVQQAIELAHRTEVMPLKTAGIHRIGVMRPKTAGIPKIAVKPPKTEVLHKTKVIIKINLIRTEVAVLKKPTVITDPPMVEVEPGGVVAEGAAVVDNKIL